MRSSCLTFLINPILRDDVGGERDDGVLEVWGIISSYFFFKFFFSISEWIRLNG